MTNNFPVLVLAGGLATRLRPYSNNLPKSLIKIGDKPFIDIQLEKLFEEGVKNVVLCIGKFGKKIKSHVGDGSKYGLNIKFSDEGENLLGTGGAIVNALDKIQENFFVLYGDSLLQISFFEVEKFFLSQRKPALMTIFKNNDDFDKSNVEYLDGEILLYSKSNINKKMNYIDYGLSIFNKSVFKNYVKGEKFDISDLMESLSIKGELSSYKTNKRFYEIGSIKGYKELKEKFEKNGNNI